MGDLTELAHKREELASRTAFGPVARLGVRTHAELAAERHEEIVGLLREILHAATAATTAATDSARRPCGCRVRR